MKIHGLVFPEAERCEVEELELDERLAPGELLVRNTASLVSPGTELAMFTRTHRAVDDPEFKWAKLPFRPGYAAIGEVLAGPPGWPPGTRVLHEGRHATHAKTAVARVVRVPPGLADEHAVFFRLAQIALTAPRVVPVRLGSPVLVIGLGLIGNLCAQLYRQGGASLVAGADLSASRQEKARQCGLDVVFDCTQRSLKDCLAELGPEGPSIVVEATGSGPGINAALKSVAPHGAVVLLGSPRTKVEIDPYYDIHRKFISVWGAHENAVDPATRGRDAAFLLDWLRGGRLNVAPLLTHVLPAAQALEAYAGLRDRPDLYLGVVLTYGAPH